LRGKKSNPHEESYPYQCQTCQRKFLSKELLKFHNTKVHSCGGETNKKAFTTIKTFACPLCKIKMPDENRLSLHTKLYHSHETDVYQQALDGYEFHQVFSCEECPNSFPTQSSLFFHRNLKHKRNTTYCKLCRINFKTSGGLHVHKRSIHISELDAFDRKFEIEDMIHKCTFCEKTYVTEISLKHHMHRRHPRRKSQPVMNFEEALGERCQRNRSHSSQEVKTNRSNELVKNFRKLLCNISKSK